MKTEFYAKLRNGGTSMIITVPQEIVAVMEIKEGQILKFNIEII